MANGRVITGYSLPVYFKQGSETPATTDVKPIARGVDASIAVESTDNLIFYADNGEAENIPGYFKSATLTLNVDGMFDDAANALFGRAEPAAPTTPETNGWQTFNKNVNIPTVAVGFIVRFISAGHTFFTPFILPRCTFKPEATTAKTQGENIEFQTQSIEAKVSAATEAVGTSVAVGDWKYTGRPYDDTAAKYLDGYETEAEAMTALKSKIITVF